MTKLRELRKNTGRSMIGFALDVGMEPSHLSIIERGKRPSKRTAQKIAAELNREPVEIWPEFENLRDY